MPEAGDDPRLEALVDFVVRLAAGDLGARLEPRGDADSIEAVVVGLNMLAEELEVLYAGLEQHVAERTVQLEHAQAELQRQALQDPLTGLPNRTLFGDRITHALACAERGARPPVVLMLDLDGFKLINDRLGHAGGDMVLVEVGRRLLAVARKTDTVARFGGDEFAVLITDATPADGLRIAERALAELRLPQSVGHHVISPGASIGVCIGSPGQTADSLLQDADTAMYLGKAAGRNRIQVFQPAMRAAALARVRIADELETALVTDQLTVFYQPFVELSTGRVVGAEALVRWQHPERGLVLPGEFIRIAEETGVIVQVGRVVAAEAIRQLADWQAEQVLPEAFRLHVNASPVEFRGSGFVSYIQDTLRRCRVPASRLTMEITETGLMGDEAEIRETLQELRSLGIGLALDDFGTGYSSISYLRQLPVDAIKIDQSLVRGIDTDVQQRNLVAAIVQLVDAVGLQPIAEGVETAAQAAQLRSLACAQGQGYHFSPPLPADEMGTFLRAQLAQSDRQGADTIFT